MTVQEMLPLEQLPIALSQEVLAEFCQRWKVQEFYLFGSVLRDDFRLDSDIDVMVRFKPDARWGLKFVRMKYELEDLLQREVDLLMKESIEESHNWIRQAEILGTARLIYVAR
ncbi:MAG: nucleotidyltransferase domain-containing protein [Cyanobacteria bacterium SBLK]|nr:nucleotidyltransferase domain-containing protein [Cyanobacteria bacterium SBLK]